MKSKLLVVLLMVFVGCTQNKRSSTKEPDIFVVVLGIAQDAGYPQANCNKECCTKVWNGEVKREKVVSLGLVDKPNNKVYLFEATPDFKDQLQDLLGYLPNADITSVGGIFLTHAHIGHYTGLMHLGHEVMGAKNVPVYAMPKMKTFIKDNGPWSQLVSYNNINLNNLQADSTVQLSEEITVTPFLVPHRDEYSETVGYKIEVNGKSMLFIPDIAKWKTWERNILKEVEQSVVAFLDATFYDIGELPGRDISEIGHPFVPETMELFKNTSDSLKNKVVFIHFNHTNPLLHQGEEYKTVVNNKFRIASEGFMYSLD
jgi:pyrroloquinoline quinone biosynthesis protein B